MKKFLCVLLCLTTVLCLAACGGSKAEAPESALVLMNKVWETYEDTEKFPAGGGDSSEENTKMDMPGKYSVAEPEALDATFGVSVNDVALIEDAASLMHLMNANTFTAGAFKLKDAKKAKDFADSLRDSLATRQWMCGFPDKYVIVEVDGYIVSVFGNSELADTFISKLKSCYSSAKVHYDEAAI